MTVHTPMTAPTAKSEPSSPGKFDRRQRVWKACDRCRLRKTKCCGSNPCTKCRRDNEVCIFSTRKRSDERSYSPQYVDMLEKQQMCLIRGIEELCKRIRTLTTDSALRDSAFLNASNSIHDILDHLGVVDRGLHITAPHERDSTIKEESDGHNDIDEDDDDGASPVLSNYSADPISPAANPELQDLGQTQPLADQTQPFFQGDDMLFWEPTQQSSQQNLYAASISPGLGFPGDTFFSGTEPIFQELYMTPSTMSSSQQTLFGLPSTTFSHSGSDLSSTSNFFATPSSDSYLPSSSTRASAAYASLSSPTSMALNIDMSSSILRRRFLRTAGQIRTKSFHAANTSYPTGVQRHPRNNDPMKQLPVRSGAVNKAIA